jgi:hypothetical protein
MKRFLAAAAALAWLAACSQSGGTSASASPSASPVSQATNPIDFPLYAQSSVLSAKRWHQTVGSQAAAGEEVIAETPATLAQLAAWLQEQTANPPPGYTVAASGSSVESAHERAARLGIDFQVFTHEQNGKPHALAVVAFDPVLFDAKAGAVLTLASNYKMLPAGIRDSIDASVKERTGFTVSEALDKSTPIGAALSAAQTLRGSGKRGLLLIDGVKH